ncbi:MerR family transcriptional regulator [Streptomyces californicus]|uniref:MerR family transcriptional regulator n=1 Tax=Streptomyces TaxID=1883 RepID=UPI00099626F2|nr:MULTISPECIES: MerR family transcriptional regulator [Streptomyces]NEA08394.1 MerR family transcriptional regulator [Streptomyces sp. SID10692]
MTWSTRQVAELAGTTLKTVRHYHKLGLLDEPERSANGYKRYGVKHLVRLMGIRRLVDLGVQLADVPSVQAADGRAEQILRTLDGELARNIERQQRMRREIAAVLDDGASLGLPPEFGAAASDLPQPQQALLVAYSSILTPRAMSVIREQFAAPRDDSATEFEQLTEDATEEERDRLARLLAAEARRQQEAHPFIADLDASSRRDGAVARSVVAQALAEFSNTAQLDVLRRMHALLAAEEHDEGEERAERAVRGGRAGRDRADGEGPVGRDRADGRTKSAGRGERVGSAA